MEIIKKTKIFTVVVGFIFTIALTMNTSVMAASLTTDQVGAIIALLESWNTDQETINAVETTLTGESKTVTISDPYGISINRREVNTTPVDVEMIRTNTAARGSGDIELFQYTITAQEDLLVKTTEVSFTVDNVNVNHINIKIIEIATGVTVAGPNVSIAESNTTQGVIFTDYYNLTANQSRTFRVIYNLTSDIVSPEFSNEGKTIATHGTCSLYVFCRNLTVGDIGADVEAMQEILNTDVKTQVAATGIGSAGEESEYFGPLTKAAVIKFQDKYAAEVLTPIGLAAGTGYVGSMTLAKLNELSTCETP